jgi:hypothetical protein
MTDTPNDRLIERATVIAMMLLTYAGLYLTDKEEALSVMSIDSTLSEMFPSDAQLAIMLAFEMFAASADLDAEDVRVMAQAIIDEMARG